MKVLLAVVGVLALVVGVVAFFGAETVMHQIVGGTLFVTAAVLLAGAGIIAAIGAIPETQLRHDAMLAKAVRESQTAQAHQTR